MSELKPEALFTKEMEDEVVKLTQDLVRMKSVNPPGDERRVAEFTARYLEDAGFTVEFIDHDADRASMLARLKGSGEAPGVLYSAHLDTVPVGAEKWLHEPFDGEIADDKIWGRGSTDMKSGMAAIMVSAKLLAKAKAPLKGDIVIALTAGEETDSLGAVEVAKRKDLGPLQALIVAEPSANDIFVAEKGALWLEIATHGKTAHGSMPDLGRNAILMMVAFLNEFEKLEFPYTEHPMLGKYSRSVDTITGGVKTNVVPDYCAITIDMRTVPGQDHAQMVKQIEALFAQLQAKMPDFKATVTVINDRPPVTTPVDDPAVTKFNAALAEAVGKATEPKGVRYYTDAAALAPALNLPMIICGPGRAELCHVPNEYVDIDLLVQAVKIYTLATLKYLG
ncbi:MAG: M20 family metallopeptidase [Anaerolineales bacterium]|jgi:succinyl-diaminopimelate desuccinylase|nr:M20 family metallopeptidase [Anaerolineales bacterium]